MNRRDAVFALLDGGLDGNPPQTYVPAAFFLHFDPSCHRGQAAVDKHAEFFRFTGMDFVKIQFECQWPKPKLEKPADWADLPTLGDAFYGPPLEVVRGLVGAFKAEAPVVLTLYSPFMFAAHLADKETLRAHMQEDPEAVKKGFEIITEGMLKFVGQCADAGLDGFYHSTQGGESHRFEDPRIFAEYIKPFDLEVMREIDRRFPFNILHVCDYAKGQYGGYDDLAPFLDYPGHVVNASLEVAGKPMTPQELSKLFGRPFMGGMERLGVLATGTEEQVRTAAREALAAGSGRYVLGADCTVPGDTPWENLRTAINEAHAWRRA